MFGCGCLGLLAGFGLAIIVGVMVVVALLPTIGLRLAGFTPKGSTSSLFTAVTPVSVAQPANPITPSQVTVDLGQYGVHEIAPSTSTYSIVVGDGGQTATAAFTEAGLLELCRQWSDICANTNSQFRNPSIDLRPGGAIVYADVNVPQSGISQRIGLVLQLDGSRTQFQVAGMDVGGALYALPSGQLSDSVTQFEQTTNGALHRMALQADGGQYHLSEIAVDDNTLTLIMR
jgi:hypothetical protein